MEKYEIVIEYPEKFPITGPLREVFSERLKTFFKGCNAWSCSSEGSLPEKLFGLRIEMQQSIGYPPPWPNADMLHPERQVIGAIIPHEELLSWKGLQTRSMEDLPPIVRDAGLDLASRILGIQIRYEAVESADSPLTKESLHRLFSDMPTFNPGQPQGGTPGQPQPQQDPLGDLSWTPKPIHTPALCPFTNPSIISELTKTWSIADRTKLRHQIQKHVAVAAGIALIVGMVMGVILTPTGSNHTVIYSGYPRHTSVQVGLESAPIPAFIAPRQVTPTPAVTGANSVPPPPMPSRNHVVPG
jgi:hypothetical protein